MNISIAIVDKDLDYLSRLVEGLTPFDLTISVYTNVENLEEAIPKKKFDVVLFDPDVCDRTIIFGETTKLPVCLYSDECMNSMRYDNVVKVAKYQRISNIYNEILREFADKAGGAQGLDKSGQTTVVSVYSPTGGAGKTTVALSLAAKIRDLGEEVLFLSLEQISSSSVVNPSVEEGVTALLSSINDKNVNFELKVRGLAKRGIKDIFYIEGFERIVDYMDVSADEITDLIAAIKRLGFYKSIILDLGSSVDSKTKAILETSDHVVLVQTPDEIGNAKMDSFVNQSLAVDIEKKFLMVSNKAEIGSSYSKKNTYPQIGMIHNYGNLQLRAIVQNICANNEIKIERLWS